MGRWVIERADPAPWNEAGYTPEKAVADAYVGKTVTFASDHIEGPDLLACKNTTYKFVDVPRGGSVPGRAGGNRRRDREGA
jgi:hypothetical protein